MREDDVSTTKSNGRRLLYVSALVGVTLAGVGLFVRNQAPPSRDGVYETAAYTFKDGNGESINIREVLVVQGEDVTVKMEEWASNAKGSTQPGPVLTWQGKVIDHSQQILAVKRMNSVDRRFFRFRDDGVVEELVRKKEFSRNKS